MTCETLDAKICVGEEISWSAVETCCGSDLMKCYAQPTNINCLHRLANMQVIRTADMIDLCSDFGKRKLPGEDMLV